MAVWVLNDNNVPTFMFWLQHDPVAVALLTPRATNAHFVRRISFLDLH